MKIVFAGTASFAVPSLEAVVNLCHQSDEYELVSVYTQPDRLSGRGRSLQANPIKRCAWAHQLVLYQPASLKKQAVQASLQEIQPDLLVVAAYGLLLPSAVLTIPRFGCINVHGSLLPRWRGAAPIQWALLAGDVMTGVTIMQMNVGLDTGSILYQVEEPVLPLDTTASLERRLAMLGAKALITTIQQLSERQTAAQPQSKVGCCYASKLSKQVGVIDWSRSAIQIERQIRAFNPWPVSFSWIQEEKIRIWGAMVQPAQNAMEVLPGTIVAISKMGITVATGKDYLQLSHLQREGGRCLQVVDLLNGSLSHLRVGMHFKQVE